MPPTAASSAATPSTDRLESTPAEQLFGVQWSDPASAQAPAPSVAPDAPAIEEREALTEPSIEPKRKFGFGGKKRSAQEPNSELEAELRSVSVEPGESPSFAAGAFATPAPPVQARPEPAQFTGAPAQPPHAPSQFHSGQSYPPGPHSRLGTLVPTPQEKHDGLGRLDVAALVAAILLPPIGLVLGIVAIIKGKQIRGWASDLARAAISVSLVMTVVFAAVGGYLWFNEAEKAEQLAQVKADQRARALIVTASAPFCEVLVANPTIFGAEDPDYGWPALDAPEGYLPAITNYSNVWAQLAEVAPAGIVDETTAVSQRVAGVVQIASALGNSNRAGDLLGLHEKPDVASVEAWYIEYCAPAE